MHMIVRTGVCDVVESVVVGEKVPFGKNKWFPFWIFRGE